MFTSNYAYHNDLQRQCNQLVASLRDHIADQKMSLIVHNIYDYSLHRNFDFLFDTVFSKGKFSYVMKIIQCDTYFIFDFIVGQHFAFSEIWL